MQLAAQLAAEKHKGPKQDQQKNQQKNKMDQNKTSRICIFFMIFKGPKNGEELADQVEDSHLERNRAEQHLSNQIGRAHV